MAVDLHAETSTDIRTMPLPRWVEPQLSKLVERAPTGPNWDQCARLRSKAESDRRANTDRSGRKLRTRKIGPLLPVKIGPMNGQGNRLKLRVTNERRAESVVIL
jgi:hypothetical protein